jgi:hypothetical protein
MAEQPPLSRIYVIGYSANDRSFPILAQVLDPRVAGYRVPEDLSTCPDKRYPNHVFTGAQPLSGDERVRHTWEILPTPYTPFTRYDDDLGPVQGRRRFVANSGQEATLERDRRVTFESREGSAIVSTEIEESWDGGSTDPDVESPFPIKDRDFYEPSRGAVQERRQLVSTTGNEVATLENKDGVITQTSYEAYNEFLSFKVVQTYNVDGPQLVGQTTDNDGQLVTVTTQRKGSDNYTPPSPTATRTVEANREDAESLVERIVDTPEVFGAEIYRKTREDLTPQKFKAAQEDSTIEQNVDGVANPAITLATGEFLKSEQQVNKFVKRVSTTSRSTTVTPEPLVEQVVTGEGQVGTRTLTLASGPQTISPSATMVDGNVEALGDGRTVKSETFVPNVFSGRSVVKTKVDLTPEKFRAAQQDVTTEESVEGTVDPTIALGSGEFRKSEQQVTEFVKRVSATSRDITASTDLEEVVITQQGQIAQRTLILSSQPQSIQPDELLVDGSIEELGDGRTIKTEVRVPSLFKEDTVSIERPDTTPQKFQIASPTRTFEFLTKGEVDRSVGLFSGEISKSEQQVTEFVKRVRVTSRLSPSPTILTGTQFTTEHGGGIAAVTETYPFDGSVGGVEFGVVSDEVEDLGNGERVRRQIKLPKKQFDLKEFSDEGKPLFAETMAVLRGQEYDEELDIVIPYRQVVADPATTKVTEGQRRRVTPKDPSHSLVQKYDIEDVQESLDDYYWEIPDMVTISLPDKLISVTATRDSSGGRGSGAGFGDTYYVSSSGEFSTRGKVIYDIEEGFKGTIPATRAIFFLAKEFAGTANVLSRVKVNSGVSGFFPNTRPQSHELVTFGETAGFESSESVSFDSGSTSSSRRSSFSTDSTSIPPTIHGELEVGSNTAGGSLASSFKVSPNVLPATQPFSIFPTGKFLYAINATPYKFSYVRVEAVIVEITSEYV